MSEENVRVRYLIAVEVSGSRHEPGVYEADVEADEAKALVDAGRVEIVKPLKPEGEDRPIPPLPEPEPNSQAVPQT